ncbi:MAG: CGNR zinc finger domain-containing protein [Actinomycetales bacterium]
MDLASEADAAVALVNTVGVASSGGISVDSLSVPSDLASLLPPDRTVPAGGLTPTHLAIAREGRRRLRMVFDCLVDGQVEDGLRELNALLDDTAVIASVVRGRSRLRLHVRSPQGDPASDLVAAAVIGLAARLSVDGVERIGRCLASPCRNVYLDTSTNRSRRYCSERCATRANVAAYRARRRAAAGDGQPTVPPSREAPDDTGSSAPSAPPAPSPIAAAEVR